MEIWKRIEDFPEYEVSTMGRVISYRGKLPKVLAGSKSPKGYIAFMFRRPGSRKPVRREVHRLAAKAFIPNPHQLPDVAHNDGKPFNNEIENLRWSTHRDNIMDSRVHGTMPDGEKCVTCKLTSAQIIEIRERLSRGEVGRRICKEYGISQSHISRIKIGKRWASMPINA